MEALALNTDARSTAQAGDAALFGRQSVRGGTSASEFSSVLGKIQQREDEDPEAFARRSAENFVAIGLVQPLLKQMRESNHAAPPFAPTQAEKQFQGLADAELAQRMVRVSNFPLVNKIADKLLEKYRAKTENTTPAAEAKVEVTA
jgi:Rod binding domain-containing protein